MNRIRLCDIVMIILFIILICSFNDVGKRHIEFLISGMVYGGYIEWRLTTKK